MAMLILVVSVVKVPLTFSFRSTEEKNYYKMKYPSSYYFIEPDPQVPNNL